MSINGRELPPRIKEALREHVARGPAGKPVFMSDLMRRVRFVMPDLEFSDQELEDAIAEDVLASSKRPVLFDGRNAGVPEK